MRKFVVLVVLGAILIGIGSGLLLFQLRDDNNIFTEINTIVENWFIK